MKLLAIESSCDETAAAVLRDGEVLSNVIASQDEHLRYGGVVPELASRAHIERIVPVVDRALQDAGSTLEEIGAVAATQGPGLVGSLLVGLTFAKGIALGRNIPLYGINHLEGHLFSGAIEYESCKPPFLCVLVSGGHTILVHVRDAADYDILGETRDDAAGEAFDKVARVLGLPYPGGPAVEKLARQGDAAAITFPVANLKPNELDFSFSGLKTAVMYHYRDLDENDREAARADIAASFQEAVIAALCRNLDRALAQVPVENVVLAGGVAQNKTLAVRIQAVAEAAGKSFFVPAPAYCTDNAAMIGMAAHLLRPHMPPSPLSIAPQPNLSLI